MLGLVTQTSVYHWTIEGGTIACCQLFNFTYTYASFLYVLSCFNYFTISLLGDSGPEKMFERTANLANNQIINYRCDPSGKWLVLIGIAPGSPDVSGLIPLPYGRNFPALYGYP